MKICGFYVVFSSRVNISFEFMHHSKHTFIKTIGRVSREPGTCQSRRTKFKTELVLILLVSLMLVSCAWQKPEKYYDESGRELYRIDCKHKIDECNTIAEKTCPNGYNTITSFFLPITYYMAGSNSKVVKYYLLVECK